MTNTSKRILCIEDDHETASLIAEELFERGFDVSIAFNGQEGFAAILKLYPDLVLCDINMPVMSGFEVLERLSALSPHFESIPFVFLTALSDRNLELKGRKLGADDYITKPIDFDLLNEIIASRLRHIARSEAWTQHTNLTDREIETLTWSARGKRSNEIADILSLSKRTVDFHIESAIHKLGVANRIEAVVKAASGRLIKP